MNLRMNSFIAFHFINIRRRKETFFFLVQCSLSSSQMPLSQLFFIPYYTLALSLLLICLFVCFEGQNHHWTVLDDLIPIRFPHIHRNLQVIFSSLLITVRRSVIGQLIRAQPNWCCTTFPKLMLPLFPFLGLFQKRSMLVLCKMK